MGGCRDPSPLGKKGLERSGKEISKLNHRIFTKYIFKCGGNNRDPRGFWGAEEGRIKGVLIRSTIGSHQSSKRGKREKLALLKYMGKYGVGATKIGPHLT